MTCGFDKGLLAAHYDGETTAEERVEVERHLAGCPECARDLASMKNLSAALKPLSRSAAPMSIAEGVLRDIAPVRSVSRSWVGWASSAAAALLLAVGTFYILDREKSAPDRSTLASDQKAGTPRSESLRRQDDAESQRHDSKVPAKAPPADPAPPAAPAPMAEEPLGKGRDDEGRLDDHAEGDKAKEAPAAEPKSRMGAKPVAPGVPVVRVKAADVAKARAEVEAFLAERELKLTPGAPLLGRSAYVRDHYVQLDLTAEEAALLDKRIAELKDTSTARTTLELEKKRLAEELARLKPMNEAQEGAKPADADATKDRAGELEEGERLRGVAGGVERDAKRLARPVRVIYVFEAVPARR